MLSLKYFNNNLIFTRLILHISDDDLVVLSESNQTEIAAETVINPETDVVYTPVINFHDYTYTGPQSSTEEMLEAAQKRITELEKLVEKKSFYMQLHAMPDRSVKFHTGFSSFKVLVTTFNALKPTADKMYRWSQIQRQRNKGSNDLKKLRKTHKSCKLSLFDQFYIFCTK